MELKPGNKSNIATKVVTFNQTRMELKHNTEDAIDPVLDVF